MKTSELPYPITIGPNCLFSTDPYLLLAWSPPTHCLSVPLGNNSQPCAVGEKKFAWNRSSKLNTFLWLTASCSINWVILFIKNTRFPTKPHFNGLFMLFKLIYRYEHRPVIYDSPALKTNLGRNIRIFESPRARKPHLRNFVKDLGSIYTLFL